MLPVIFFVHNRRDTTTHWALFNWALNQIEFPANVPFVTDREHSIVNNILGHAVYPRQLFYCTIHILSDVRNWCRGKKYLKSEIDRYVDHAKKLIAKKSVDSFDETLEKLSLDRKREFTDYFTKQINPSLLDNLRNNTETEFAHFETKAITSNLSESWHNKLPKHFTKAQRENMRLDHLASQLFKIQTDCLDEYNRAVDDEGRRFTLKEDAYKTAIKLDLKHGDLNVKDMLQKVKEQSKTELQDYFVDGAENPFEIELADLVKKLNLIQYLGPFKSLFVGHPYNVRDVRQVVLEKGK